MKSAENADALHLLLIGGHAPVQKNISKTFEAVSFKVTAVENAEKTLQFLRLEDGSSGSRRRRPRAEKGSSGRRHPRAEEGSPGRPRRRRGEDFKPPDLILTEYEMPGGMDGYEFLCKVKTSALREIPVVLMSREPHLHPDCLVSCLSEGAHAFLAKPIYTFEAENLKDFIMKSKAENEY